MSHEHELVLSAAASRRMREALPGLLGAVRWRRRRRVAVRAAALSLLVAVWSWSPWSGEPSEDGVAPGPVASAPRWVVIADDPSVLARCEVASRIDPAWFVDDAGLQNLLRLDARPDGLVRAGARVMVAAAAVDAWPAAQAP